MGGDALSQEFFDDDETAEYHVKLEQFTLPIAENFTCNGSDFVSFAEITYDDYCFMVLELNEKYEIESMGYGDRLELCYG